MSPEELFKAPFIDTWQSQLRIQTLTLSDEARFSAVLLILDEYMCSLSKPTLWGDLYLKAT